MPPGDVTSGVMVLTADFLKASDVLNSACAAQREGATSSLVEGTRAVLGADPTAIIPAFFNMEDIERSGLRDQNVNAGTEIELQHVGLVKLTQSCRA